VERAVIDSVSASFLELHKPGEPLLIPNPWDVGTARQLESLGYRALATTSSGFAGTLGRGDGRVTRDEAIEHGGAIVEATNVPVSADLENGFSDEPAGVAETVRRAAAMELAGCSIEDYTGSPDDPIYERAFARERIVAAAEVARDAKTRIVLTARAENYLHGRADLADTIERLQAFQEAGADVLYAPGLSAIGEIDELVRSLDRPVNVLLRPGLTVAALAKAGVARISVGGAFQLVAMGAVETAARELLECGTSSYWEQAKLGLAVRSRAFD
jgi:2-methylisocitrate lyase-like PEP mutase family enzyme